MVRKIADPSDVTVKYVEPAKKITPVRGSVKTEKSWVTNLKKKVETEFEKTRQERKKTIYKILHDAGISDEEIKTIKGP